jgi:hypothetical protein
MRMAAENAQDVVDVAGQTNKDLHSISAILRGPEPTGAKASSPADPQASPGYSHAGSADPLPGVLMLGAAVVNGLRRRRENSRGPDEYRC